MPEYSSYIWWRGGKFDSETIPSILMAEKVARLPVRVVQGGYNRGGVAASAGTHDGGAVFDMSVSGWSGSQINNMLRALRLCGWAAWHRTPAEGFVHHIHSVSLLDGKASWPAKAQTISYKNRRNGLANNGYDDGPRVEIVTWSHSPYNPNNRKPSKPNKSKPREQYDIMGKKYAPMYNVSLYWVLNARKSNPKHPSRPANRVQVWLKDRKSGGYYNGPLDGIWGPQTQAAYDHFRRYKLNYKNPKDYTGAPGMTSLQKLRSIVGDTRFPVVK